MIYTHLKCSNKFKLRCYAMLPHCRATLRLPPQTPMLLPESIYTRLSTVVCSRFARQANIRRAEILCHWKARARRRKAAGLHSLPVRRVPPWIARVYRVQTRVGSRRDVSSARTNGQAVRLRLLFVLFLYAQEKNTFLLSKGERYQKSS